MTEPDTDSTLREIKTGSFIFEMPDALALDICNEIIRRFEERQQDQTVGRVGQMATEDRSVKRSMDIFTSGKDAWQDIDQELFRSLSRAIVEFRERFPFFKGSFKDIGYNLQRYQAGGHYHWHIDGGSHDFADRQLVAIWYLNDVQGPGGETEFSTQGVKVIPQAGKLVLFPPFWTHEHRAVMLESGVKYIATTWVVFA